VGVAVDLQGGTTGQEGHNKQWDQEGKTSLCGEGAENLQPIKSFPTGMERVHPGVREDRVKDLNPEGG